MKLIKKKAVAGDLQAVFDEVNVLKGLDHPNIGAFKISISKPVLNGFLNIDKWFAYNSQVLRLVRKSRQVLSRLSISFGRRIV